MERHIAKRLGIPCAVISAPVHVQDFPARYSPQMGFEGANVLFDTWVHPLMMGLEEHLLGMFREDFEFHDGAAPSHLGATRRARAIRRSGTADRGCRRVAGDHLDGGRREGAEQDPVLRARQGAPQHRTLRRRTRHRDHHRRDAVRCQSAFRPLSATPVRVVVVTMDSHLAGAVDARGGGAAARDLPGLELAMHAADEWGSDAAALARLPRRHRRAATSSSRPCCSSKTTSARCCRRSTARRDALRRDAVLPCRPARSCG